MRELLLICLKSWIRSGCISSTVIQNYGIAPLAFEALKSDSTFDAASDLVCEIIIQSSITPRDESLILSIYPFFKDLVSILKENSHDEDVSRALCRIFVEASEAYCDLIIKNLQMSYGILEGLVLCVSNNSLEVARITINAWYSLSEQITGPENQNARKEISPVFQSLVEIIIRQMRYPDDIGAFTAEERDDFRDFRHEIGDVLKDCVRVLGQDETLKTPYSMLVQLLDQNSSTLKWQDLEAPLFSLRAMCREISLAESTYVPQIMAMLPRFPAHPKLHYASILVIGRYASWTNSHPEMLQFQLEFVTKGFSLDGECQIAAAHAFRDLCTYCGRHLVNHLDLVQGIYTQTTTSLHEDDSKQMAEAVSSLISAVGYEKLIPALTMFCVPVANRLHNYVDLYTADDKESLKKIHNALDELGLMLKFIDISVPQGAIHPTIQFLQQLWPTFEKLFQQHGSRLSTAETISKFFRNALDSTKDHFYPLFKPFLSLLLGAFQTTTLSCYIWTCAKITKYFSTIPQVRDDIIQMVKTISERAFHIIQTNGVDVTEPGPGTEF